MRHTTRTAIAAFAFALTALTAGTAQAEPDADSAARGEDAADGTAVYNFDADSIEGELLSPEGVNVGGQQEIKHASLINIRTNFLMELVEMANDM